MEKYVLLALKLEASIKNPILKQSLNKSTLVNNTYHAVRSNSGFLYEKVLKTVQLVNLFNFSHLSSILNNRLAHYFKNNIFSKKCHFTNVKSFLQ